MEQYENSLSSKRRKGIGQELVYPLLVLSVEGVEQFAVLEALFLREGIVPQAHSTHAETAEPGIVPPNLQPTQPSTGT